MKSKTLNISLAGYFHDIVKVPLKASALNIKNLVEKDLQEYKRHPEVGYQLLRNVPKYTKVANLVLHHHERFDGKGFPKGIKGEEVPIGSRIIAIVQEYDELLKTMSEEEAYKVLERRKGTCFDLELVDLLINL